MRVFSVSGFVCGGIVSVIVCLLPVAGSVLVPTTAVISLFPSSRRTASMLMLLIPGFIFVSVVSNVNVSSFMLKGWLYL